MGRVLLVLAVLMGLGIFGVAPARAIYVDNGDTVTDTYTGLEWQQATVGIMNWNAAMAYSDLLTLNNQSDWRLPTFQELLTLVKSGSAPTIDTAFFPETMESNYWSSTSNGPSGAWIIDFGHDHVSFVGKTDSYYVRAVRGGQAESLRDLVISHLGSGSVASSPAGIACGADCVETYHYNNTITLTATPDPGATFAGWSGDADCADGVVTMNVNVACTATFGVSTQILTYTAGAHGAISGDSSQTVTYGDSGTTVTAVADSGYTFVSWSDGVATASRTDSNVSGDIAVTAFFAPGNTYVLSYTAGAGGSVSGTSPQVVNRGADGSPVIAVAATGYHFVEWSDHSTATPRTDTSITTHVMVTANFAKDTYVLTYTSGTGGAINGTTPQNVTFGASGSPVNAVADAGYRFVRWSDGRTDNPRTDGEVAEDVTVMANFVKAFPWVLIMPSLANGKPAVESVQPE